MCLVSPLHDISADWWRAITCAAPTFKFNGTHVQLPFAPPDFNGTIVCPKNATHPPAPPAPPLASLRGGARPPHGATALRYPASNCLSADSQ